MSILSRVGVLKLGSRGGDLKHMNLWSEGGPGFGEKLPWGNGTRLRMAA